MNRPKKLETKVEFVKRYLASNEKNIKCDFCKYNPANYELNSEFARIMRANKCLNCLHYPSSRVKYEILKGKRVFLDNFKPLYDWEEYDKNMTGRKKSKTSKGE